MRTQPMFTETRPSGVGAEHELGGTATDVDHEVGRRRVEIRGGTQERQRGLFLTGEQLGLDPRLARRGEELVAVRRVAGGAGGRGTHARDAELVERGPVLAQHRDGAGNRLRRERTRGVDTLPEPGDPHAPVEGLELGLAPGAVDLGDEQPDRVRPDVDRPHPAHAPTPSGCATREATQRPTGSSPPARK